MALKALAGLLVSALAWPAAPDAAGRALASGQPLAIHVPPGRVKTATAPAWMADKLAARLGLRGADRIRVIRKPRRVGGFTVLRGAQFHRGRQVLGRELVLAVADDGETRVIGRAAPITQAPAAPAIGPRRAAEIAGMAVPPRVLPLRYYPLTERSARLVYEVRLRGANRPLAAAAVVYIDARSGAEIARIPRLHTALDREVISFGALCRRLNVTGLLTEDDSTALFGAAMLTAPRRREGDSRLNEAGVDRLYGYLGAAHTFLHSLFELDSLDGQGLTLRALAGVRYSAQAPGLQCLGDGFNAAWYAPLNLMIFPDAALDVPEVIGHEMAHGLIDHGSELAYVGESGALNESIADVIGVSFRAWLAGGGAEGRPASRLAVDDALWSVREDRGITRDMSRPRRAGPYPDHYDDYVAETPDRRRMHTNSSIINQAWYLMAQGGPHPRLGGAAVDAIGLTKTARIAALAATRTLVSWADFSDARAAFALAAEILYGPRSGEWRSVHQAMDAVGVPGVWPRDASASADQETRAAPTPGEGSRAPASSRAPAAPTRDPAAGGRGAWLALMGAALGIALLLIYRGRRALGGGEAIQPDDSQDDLPHPDPTPVDPPARPRAYLQALDQSGPIPLPEALLRGAEGLVIGRTAELAHVCVENSRVSRRHLRLRATGGRLFVEDLHSTHGTCVNGQRLPPFAPGPIAEHDVIHIADFAYRLTRGTPL